MSSQLAPNIRGLVSLDGSASVISTQLRLLPPSPKILILPPLSTTVPQPEGDAAFDARAFIRHVHEVLSTRLDLARSFLQSSSSTQPRLVFMNGGSISALTTCIAAIREKVTNGNIQEAEELFKTIVKGRVAGLGETANGHQGNDSTTAKAVNGDIFSKARETRSPSTTSRTPPSATDATDFIDRLIDSLQKPLPSLPVEGGNLNMANSSENTRTTTTPVPPDVPRLKSRFWTEERVIPKAERVIPEAGRGRKRGNDGKRSNHDFLPCLRYTSRSSSTYTDAVMYQARTDFDEDVVSTQPERPASEPSSRAMTRQGESSYMEVERQLSRQVVKKAKSADCIRPRNTHLASLDIGPGKLRLETFSPFTFSPLLRSETSSVTESESSDISEGSSNLEPLPRIPYIKTLETLLENPSPLKIMSTPAPRAFVDRGTSAEDSTRSETFPSASPNAADLREPASFEPVFALVEDLIIHFKDGGGNEVLDSVFQSYKNGSYPIGPFTDHNIQQVPTTPNSPASLFSSNGTSLSGASHTSEETDYDWRHSTQEFDQEKMNVHPSKEPSDVSSDSSSNVSTDSPSVYPSVDLSIAPLDGPSDRKSQWHQKGNAGDTIHGILKPKLQIPITTPAAPPPQVITDTPQKIHELSGISASNAVTLQDSLRGILKVHYPPETTHYKQHIFAIENDRFWKPTFRKNARNEAENRTVDQIIALGYEDGVEKMLYEEIIEQLDKLGTSTTGIRASKLDIRFLVIYAMQTFTSQPLSLQAGENPFSQPSLLATLLIPHLETFLSSSCPTRLLILHYPVSHLSTVLALRDLLGPQLLKVAGIIDSTAISPPKPSNERPSSIISVNEWVSRTTSQSPSSTVATHIPPTSRKSIMPPPSFSKADFLLLSPATEEEISSFLSSLWESLTFPSSSFYIPDDVLSPSSTLRPVPSPTSASSHDATPTPPPDRKAPPLRPQQRASPTRAPKRVSFAESTTSTEMSSENARRRERQSEKDWEKVESERRERLSEKAWESFIMGNDSDESLLELERIFMPHLHFMPRAIRRIGDSRKALKWLGLD